MARDEWVDLTWEFVQQRIAQVQSRSAAVASFAEYPDALLDVGSGMVQRWRDGLTPAERERVVFFTIVGSQNQNERSMVTDGEDAVILSSWPAIIPYLDLISIVGQCHWIDDPAEVDALLPRQSGLKVRLAHWFKLAF
jgi:phosphatidylserine/phosphatidylglycerophosphate/cardiolipin synthase-like enzyme